MRIVLVSHLIMSLEPYAVDPTAVDPTLRYKRFYGRLPLSGLVFGPHISDSFYRDSIWQVFSSEPIHIRVREKMLMAYLVVEACDYPRPWIRSYSEFQPSAGNLDMGGKGNGTSPTFPDLPCDQPQEYIPITRSSCLTLHPSGILWWVNDAADELIRLWDFAHDGRDSLPPAFDSFIRRVALRHAERSKMENQRLIAAQQEIRSLRKNKSVLTKHGIVLGYDDYPHNPEAPHLINCYVSSGSCRFDLSTPHFTPDNQVLPANFSHREMMNWFQHRDQFLRYVHMVLATEHEGHEAQPQDNHPTPSDARADAAIGMGMG